MEVHALISVIVPVYNAEKYLSVCIDSILSQTFTDFELLLIDDGSSDRCGEICEEYAGKDERVRVFHQENAGVSAARNTGLKNAEGKYIAFVDSDDWILPEYLSHLYEALLPKGRGLVLAGALKRSDDNQVVDKILLPDIYCENDIMYSYVQYNLYKIGFPWSKLYNAELIRNKNINFEVRTYCFEDLFFMMDYLKYADYIVLCSTTDYQYRVNHSENSLSKKINHFDDEYYVFSSYLCRNEEYKRKNVFVGNEIHKINASLKIPFHKVLLSLYSCRNHYSYHERMKYLQKLLSNHREWIKDTFFPDYVADKIAKYILCNLGKHSFDLWMCFLWRIKFRKMFGYKSKKYD